MGKRHAAANAGLERAKADEAIRESESRRTSAERERQLLTSYLGSQEQVAGTGRFGVTPEALKYTQRYTIDARTLAEIQAAGQGIRGQTDPFQQAGRNVVEFGQGFANQANDLLAQAEAAARAGDISKAETLFAQAQTVISGVSQHAQSAFNLGGGEESAAAVRASSTEGKIVGRQLLTAQQLQDPNSQTAQGLRGRLLEPTLGAIESGTEKVIGEISQAEKEAQKVIDENTRNAERAIAAERSQIDGEIRQKGSGGGTGVNARAQLALQSRAAAEAARSRADVYSQAAAEQANVASQSGLARAEAYARESAARAAVISQVDLYLNEFAKRMAEDSVALAQEWVNGTAGVRDIYLDSLQQLDIFQAQLANQWAQLFFMQSTGGRASGSGGGGNAAVGGAASGAVAGAAAGSVAGPVGAVIGGVVGAIGGFLGSR